jgi:hypothetical protein
MITTKQIETATGNTLQLFYNSENNLIVLDLISKDESGGYEIVRQKLDEVKLLNHCK